MIAFGDAAAPNDNGVTVIWDDAERELVQAFQLGEVVASGFRHGRGQRQEIPSLFWIGAELEPLESSAFWKKQWSRENDWEQVRVYRRDVVQRWPSPLSLIQEEPAVEKLASRPGEVSVAETQPWWSLTAVEAWILARDPAAVAALCRLLSAVEKGAIFLSRHRNNASRTARRELFGALAAAEVMAHGDRGTGNGLQPIPAVEWSRLRYLYEDGSDRAGPYRDVVIPRAQALQRWPACDRPTTTQRTPLAPAESRTGYPTCIKRKGGRPAPWKKHLEKYLRLRLRRGDELSSMSLTEIRTYFLRYATKDQIRGVPSARSSLDVQIKMMLPKVLEAHPAKEEPDRDVGPSLDEIMSTPEIRRK